MILSKYLRGHSTTVPYLREVFHAKKRILVNVPICVECEKIFSIHYSCSLNNQCKTSNVVTCFGVNKCRCCEICRKISLIPFSAYAQKELPSFGKTIVKNLPQCALCIRYCWISYRRSV